MEETTGQAAWQAAYHELVARADIPAWRHRPPRLVIKQGRFSPWWSPILWLAHRPSAWSAWRSVIISAELLQGPPNRYLLAHELGHLACRHHARYLITTGWVVGLGILLATIGPSAPVPARVAGLCLFLIGVGQMIRLCSLRSEYEADTFCAKIIGQSATAIGIQEHARYVNGKLQPSTRRRMVRLQR
jgi:Zn-dependent protease with chaperone function